MDKDILITSPDEAQEDFAPAGGIERIVAEVLVCAATHGVRA